MKKQEIINLIRTAVVKGKIYFTEHADQRMRERNISLIMVEKCLLTGVAQSDRPLIHNDKYNTYECRISHYMAGVNYDVVAAIDPTDPTAIVVTVINTDE